MTSEKRSTLNFNSIDAMIFDDPETRPACHPPLFVRPFIDETAVETLESSAYSENEFHPATPVQDVLVFESRKKPLTFHSLLSSLNLSPIQFFGIILACILLGAFVGLLSERRSEVHSDSADNIQYLLEKASVVEQYLYRDEQRALHRQ
jgi:hypothetical protein